MPLYLMRRYFECHLKQYYNKSQFYTIIKNYKTRVQFVMYEYLLLRRDGSSIYFIQNTFFFFLEHCVAIVFVCTSA
jgi:hypothetical protein